jgi:hypothetical protein
MGSIARIRESSDASLKKGAHAVTAEILASIESQGYAHIKVPLSEESFETIAESLGSIALRTDLTITPNRSSIVYKPDEIGFHQDNPTINMLGWYCVQQDELDGSGRLLDAGDVASHFSPEERKVLGTINVRCPDPDPKRHNPDVGVVAYFLWPLLTQKATRCHVYYAPWLLLDSYDEEQSRAIEKFAEYLRAKEENQAIRIRLKKGESLFIDNNRMLHGRGSIQPDSKRFLKRVWIKRDS